MTGVQTCALPISIRAAVEAFEAAVTQTVDAYLAAVEGLPMTERHDLDLVV